MLAEDSSMILEPLPTGLRLIFVCQVAPQCMAVVALSERRSAHERAVNRIEATQASLYGTPPGRIRYKYRLKRGPLYSGHSNFGNLD